MEELPIIEIFFSIPEVTQLNLFVILNNAKTIKVVEIVS